MYHSLKFYTGSPYNKQNDASVSKCSLWLNIFNIAISDFEAKKSIRYSQLLSVTELVVSRTQVSVICGNREGTVCNTFTHISIGIWILLLVLRRDERGLKNVYRDRGAKNGVYRFAGLEATRSVGRPGIVWYFWRHRHQAGWWNEMHNKIWSLWSNL